MGDLMSKSHETTCVGQFVNKKMYFAKPPCEACKKSLKNIMVVGSPPNPMTPAK